jgi:NTE family protein
MALPVLGGATAVLPGCSLSPDRDHADPDAPLWRPLANRPEVAWVLSSGGPRGFVHVGVVQGLQELGLKPDLIVGASAGALVGVLCAAGFSGIRLRELALELRPWELARLAVGTAERFSALAIADWVRERVDQRPMQSLSVPMAAVAYQPASKEVVAFNAGDAGLAVAASCAIEGQFSPVRIRGKLHVDADLHQPMPVRMARSMGARRVIAVDASAHLDRVPPGAQRYRATDELKAELTQRDAREADLLIKPDFGYWVSLSREFRERAIEAGYRQTLSQAAALREAHIRRG